MTADNRHDTAFSPSVLPAHEWTVSDFSSFSIKSSSDSVRSLLTYNWKPSRDRPHLEVNEANSKASVHKDNISALHTDLPTGPRALKGFTQFGSTSSSASQKAAGISPQSRSSSLDSVHLVRLQDIIAAYDEALVPNYDRENDYDSEDEYKEPFLQQPHEKQRYMNFLGPTAEDDKSVTSCIVELLGPHCKAGRLRMTANDFEDC